MIIAPYPQSLRPSLEIWTKPGIGFHRSAATLTLGSVRRSNVVARFRAPPTHQVPSSWAPLYVGYIPVGGRGLLYWALATGTAIAPKPAATANSRAQSWLTLRNIDESPWSQDGKVQIARMIFARLK